MGSREQSHASPGARKRQLPSKCAIAVADVSINRFAETGLLGCRAAVIELYCGLKSDDAATSSILSRS